MKKIIPLLIAVCLCKIIIAQPQLLNNPYPKTISVSGSAEMEIIPDEIYVNIVLREYQKKGESKKDIEAIKTQFLEYCKSVNIPDSSISIASYSGNMNYYNFRRKKNIDMLSSITYQAKFSNSKAMDELVEKLDDNATQSFVIVSTSHSRIMEFRKQLKIKAVQAAKEKGSYLAEAVGEKLGETITINEPVEWQPFNNSYENAVLSNSNYVYKSNGFKENVQEVDFKKMKLRFEVNVVFSLK